MNAVELLTPDGVPSGVFACGRCRRVEAWRGTTVDPASADAARDRADARELADRCCTARCVVCGDVADPGQSGCAAHREEAWERRRAAREREDLAKARPRPDYPGPFLVGERVFDTLADVLAHFEGKTDRPAYLWVPRRQAFHLAADEIVDNELENNHHSDAGAGILTRDVTELQAFLDGWCESQGIVTYWEDRAEYVPLPPAGPAPGA